MNIKLQSYKKNQTRTRNNKKNAHFYAFFQLNGYRTRTKRDIRSAIKAVQAYFSLQANLAQPPNHTNI